jgi:hypothetical protein
MLNAWVGFAHPERKEIARYLLSRGLDPVGLAPAPARIAELLAPRRRLSFPRDWHRSRHPWIRRRCRRTRCPGPTSWSSPGLWTSWPASAGAHSRGEPAALAPLHPPFRRLPTQNLAPCAGGHVPAAGQLPSHPSGRDQRGVHQVRAAP